VKRARGNPFRKSEPICSLHLFGPDGRLVEQKEFRAGEELRRKLPLETISRITMIWRTAGGNFREPIGNDLELKAR